MKLSLDPWVWVLCVALLAVITAATWVILRELAGDGGGGWFGILFGVFVALLAVLFKRTGFRFNDT